VDAIGTPTAGALLLYGGAWYEGAYELRIAATSAAPSSPSRMPAHA
jgi:hypothetical protein